MSPVGMIFIRAEGKFTPKSEIRRDLWDDATNYRILLVYVGWDVKFNLKLVLCMSCLLIFWICNPLTDYYF